MTPRKPNKFRDPKTGETYEWPLNHNEEEPVNKSRQFGDGANTDEIGLIPQQGPATPLVLVWKGSILVYQQLLDMIDWWQRCEYQTIHVIDFSGAEYEVIITDFQPKRQAVAQNRNDPYEAPMWIWTYTLTMRVLTVVAGEWSTVTP